MKKSINMQLFVINKLILDEKVTSINLRTDKDAFITLLPNHSPLITNLSNSKVSLHFENQKPRFFEIETGVFYFATNKAYLIANKAVSHTK